MAPLTSAFGPFMSFMSDIYGDWSDVMVQVEVDHINGETSPIRFEQESGIASPEPPAQNSSALPTELI